MRSIGIAILMGVCALGCGDDDNTSRRDAGIYDASVDANLDAGALDAATSDSGTDDAGTDDAGMSAYGERLVEVIATENHFNPSRLYAAPGEHLIISVRNMGSTNHSFEVELPGGDEELESAIAPGETAQLRVTVPSTTGQHDYYCPISNHRALGMEGTLVVRQPAKVRLVPAAMGLTSPVALAFAPGDNERTFVVEQTGTIRVLENGKLASKPYLDLTDRLISLDDNYDERGLLGLAFHPQFAQNGHFFVFYTRPLRAGAPSGWDNTNYVSEFTATSASASQVDPSTERVLLRVDEPQPNHEGGTLAFGPDDGMLYISLGDGGGAGDIDMGHTNQLGNGQDHSNLLGSILRIDVDSGTPYGIPSDNPFASSGNGQEIFAYGFRNPYRFSFDMAGTNMLMVGDAGQMLWEEASIVVKGGNYGWNILEGTHCFDTSDFMHSASRCDDAGANSEPLHWPAVEVANSAQKGGVGTALIGGYVYRGSNLDKSLRGRYVFGTLSVSESSGSAELFVASDADGAAGNDLWPVERVDMQNAASMGSMYLKGFGQNHAGELYALTSANLGPTGKTGQVLALRPAN